MTVPDAFAHDAAGNDAAANDGSADVILHLALPDDLVRARADGRYRCASLDGEGFVHGCDADQLAGVVERYYAAVDALVLLDIDVTRLDVELRRENTVGGTERFPHVYGSIPLAAITRTRAFGFDDPTRVALTAAPGTDLEADSG